MVRDGVVTCANAGDSRALLCRAGTAVGLSRDHKPDNDEEQQRIEEVPLRPPGIMTRMPYITEGISAVNKVCKIRFAFLNLEGESIITQRCFKDGLFGCRVAASSSNSRIPFAALLVHIDSDNMT